MDSRKNKSIAVSAVCVGWGICIALILVLIFLFSDDIYACKQEFANMFVLLLQGLIVFCGISFFFLQRKLQIAVRLPVFIGLVFMAFQIWLIKYYVFQTGWDVQGIIQSAWQAARGEVIDVYAFSVYPNNILLTYIFSRILRLGTTIGLTEYHAYDLLIILQSFLFFLTGLLVFYSLTRLTEKRNLAFAGYLIYLLLIGLSPWVSIPYSDASGLIFPTAILALYLYPAEKKAFFALKWMGIGFLSWFGYQIKPTIMIVLIAVGIMGILSACKRREIKALSLHAVLLAGGIFISSLAVSFAFQHFGFEVNPEKTFGPAHFFAMGLNEDSMGIWAAEDVNYSEAILTAKERTQADLELAKERIAKMGLHGLLRQYKRKLLTNFNDGTFAWAQEGNFFRIILDTSNEKLAGIIRSFYYTDGSHFRVFLNFEHAIWLAVLFLSFFSCFTEKRQEIAVIMLTLLGFVLYGLLFEARARYVFIFSPFFIILAVMGFNIIYKNVLINLESKSFRVDKNIEKSIPA